MSERDAQNQDIEELIHQYAKAAIVYGQATEIGDHKKGNKAHKELSSIYRELRQRGATAQRALLPLLEHEDAIVRLWSASHALEFSPQDGERVLESLQSFPKAFVSFDAKMTLGQWREGKLYFP